MPYVVKPTQGELASARASVEGVFEACSQRLPTDRSVSVALAWSDDPAVVSELGGADGMCWGPEQVEIAFSSAGDGWVDAVAGVAARQYGRAWVRGRFPDETRSFWWQDILEGAAGEVLATEVAPAYSPPWVDGVEAGLGDVWSEVKPRLGESVESPLLAEGGQSGGGNADAGSELSSTLERFLPEAFAAVAATGLKTEYEVGTFPELRRSTVVDAVEEVVGDGA